MNQQFRRLAACDATKRRQVSTLLGGPETVMAKWVDWLLLHEDILARFDAGTIELHFSPTKSHAHLVKAISEPIE